MRSGRDQNWLMDGEKLIGVNLGADHCAEHEWGIKDIKRSLGIDENDCGIDARKIRRLEPKCLRLVDTKVTKYGRFTTKKGKETNRKTVKARALIFCKEYFWDYTKEGEYPGLRELTLYNEQTLATAWDQGSFGILVTEEHFDKLQALYDAFLNMDVAVWLGGGGVFQNAGLVVAILSRVPEEGKNTMLHADIDRFSLQEAHKRSGIEEELRAAGKSWYALSPRWKDDKKEELVWWLNPAEQDIHNYGWFELKDLKLWAQNKGRCMGGRKGRAA